MLGIILAAGKGSRYGDGDKNSIYIEHNISLLSECDRIIIVVNDKNEPNYERYRSDSISIIRQDPSIYGTGAALLSIKEHLADTKFIVLLGDNYTPSLGDLKNIPNENDFAIASYVDLEESNENLRFAYVTDENMIIEKPHNYTKGKYYAGYMIFGSKNYMYLNDLAVSKRGEYEITDFFNMSKNRITVEVGKGWKDITKKSDTE